MTEERLLALLSEVPRLTYTDIAARLGVSVGAVGRIAARHGLSRRGRGPTPTQRMRLQHIRAARAGGKTWTEIAAEQGVSRQHLHKLRRAHAGWLAERTVEMGVV